MHPTGRQMREGCGIEQPSFGAPEDRKKRWCAGGGKAHGAIHLTYHPLRLRLDLIWSEMEEGDSQVLVCALATLDRWIALGEQLMVGFCRVGKARSARKFWRVTRN